MDIPGKELGYILGRTDLSEDINSLPNNQSVCIVENDDCYFYVSKNETTVFSPKFENRGKPLSELQNKLDSKKINMDFNKLSKIKNSSVIGGDNTFTNSIDSIYSSSSINSINTNSVNSANRSSNINSISTNANAVYATSGYYAGIARNVPKVQNFTVNGYGCCWASSIASVVTYYNNGVVPENKQLHHHRFHFQEETMFYYHIFL